MSGFAPDQLDLSQISVLRASMYVDLPELCTCNQDSGPFQTETSSHPAEEFRVAWIQSTDTWVAVIFTISDDGGAAHLEESQKSLNPQPPGMQRRMGT